MSDFLLFHNESRCLVELTGCIIFFITDRRKAAEDIIASAGNTQEDEVEAGEGEENENSDGEAPAATGAAPAAAAARKKPKRRRY